MKTVECTASVRPDYRSLPKDRRRAGRSIRPFLKWAGNKYRIIEKIKSVLPEGSRLIEPFCGSGAVFLNTSFSEYWLNDINPDVISLYTFLQTEGESFIQYAKTWFSSEFNNAESYFQLRHEFNHTTDKRHKAGLFLYLNRYGYNGLCRYNAKGHFNVPFGRYRRPYFPEPEMMAFATKSQEAKFTTLDFMSVLEQAQVGDVIYCDPPYVPLSATSKFTQYHAARFSHVQQLKLADAAKSLRDRGVSVLISNHDNAFTRTAYDADEFTSFDVRRLISSDGENRGKAPELLALFRGQSAK